MSLGNILTVQRAAREEVRERAGRRTIPPEAEKKSWREVVLAMGKDNFAAIGFRQTGNEIAAAAAFEFRREIADGTMGKEMFTAMMKEINAAVRKYK